MSIDGKVVLVTGAGQGIGRKATTFKADVTKRAGPGSDYMTGQAPLSGGGLVYR